MITIGKLIPRTPKDRLGASAVSDILTGAIYENGISARILQLRKKENASREITDGEKRRRLPAPPSLAEERGKIFRPRGNAVKCPTRTQQRLQRRESHRQRATFARRGMDFPVGEEWSLEVGKLV